MFIFLFCFILNRMQFSYLFQVSSVDEPKEGGKYIHPSIIPSLNNKAENVSNCGTYWSSLQLEGHGVGNLVNLCLQNLLSERVMIHLGN